MNLLIIFSFLVCTILAGEYSHIEGEEFGPSNWYLLNANCGGSNQSPINIDTKTVVVNKRPPIKLSYFNKKINAINLKNDGDDITITFDFAGNSENSFEFDGQTYIFDNVHIHWGDAQSCNGGSEHTINGIRYAAEAHFVHHNKKYGSVANSLAYNDGLAVIGFLLKLTNPHKFADFDYLKYIDYIIPADSVYTIDVQSKLTLNDLIKGDAKKYYYYRGSLTTPPCSPVVQWIVSTDLLEISQAELRALNKLQRPDGSPILINYRPLQAIGSRVVNVNTN